MIILALLAVAAFFLLWPIFASDQQAPATVRPLTSDEQAAWGLYRIQDAARVARMKHTREQDRHKWDLNRAHAEGFRYWLTRKIGRSA